MDPAEPDPVLDVSVAHPLPATKAWAESQVALSVFDWERWWVFSTTRRGDALISEAYSPANTDKGRPAVYLWKRNRL